MSFTTCWLLFFFWKPSVFVWKVWGHWCEFMPQYCFSNSHQCTCGTLNRTFRNDRLCTVKPLLWIWRSGNIILVRIRAIRKCLHVRSLHYFVLINTFCGNSCTPHIFMSRSLVPSPCRIPSAPTLNPLTVLLPFVSLIAWYLTYSRSIFWSLQGPEGKVQFTACLFPGTLLIPEVILMFGMVLSTSL